MAFGVKKRVSGELGKQINEKLSVTPSEKNLNEKIKAEARQKVELKNMLIEKFKKKYLISESDTLLATSSKAQAQKQIRKAIIIEKIINDFLSKEKLTAANLEALDLSIKKAANLQEFQLNIPMDEPPERIQTSELKKLQQATPSNQVFQQEPMVRSHSTGFNQKLKTNQDSSHYIENKKSSEQKEKFSSTNPRKGFNYELVPNFPRWEDYLKDEDNISVASSKAPRSVYQMQDRGHDEWAVLVDFDTQLYKKEQQMKELRLNEQKKRLRQELDLQMEEKKRREKYDKQDLDNFALAQISQLRVYDDKEQQILNDRRQKLKHEKVLLDQQVNEYYKRKRNERKYEKEFDRFLVEKIKEEVDREELKIRQRRKEEAERFKRLLEESAKHREAMKQEEKLERIKDIEHQQAYTDLIEKQEKERQDDRKKREERWRGMMEKMGDGVLLAQREKINAENELLQKYFHEVEDQIKKEEETKKKKTLETQAKEREILNKQIEERKQKKEEEHELDVRQADFWKKDTLQYLEENKQRAKMTRELCEKHKSMLTKQIESKKDKFKFPRMNDTELLQNKKVLKEVATAHTPLDFNFQKKLLDSETKK